VFGVSLDLPVNKALEVVQHHVLVAFYLLVSEDDAQVDSSGVHLVLVLNLVLAEELEVMLQDVRRFFHIAFGTFFVIEKTKLQGGFGLSFSAVFALRNRKHFVQVFNSLRNVIILRVSFS